MFEEFFPFIWAGIIGILGYAIWHKLGDMFKAKWKHQQTTKNYSGDKNIDGQMEAFIQNAPRLLAEISEEIKKQRTNGVNDQQMSGLLQKQKMLEFIVQNKELIDIIGKPILKKLVGFIKAI